MVLFVALVIAALLICAVFAASGMDELEAENRQTKAELEETSRMLEDQLRLRADAMDAGKAMLREAMKTQNRANKEDF